MYQPFDPYVYQPYNDPQPEHYASGVPQGMPQPARPSVFGSTEPAYSSYQDQFSYGGNSSYDAQYGSQPYGAQAQPSFYPANPTPSAPDYGSLSHTGSQHYPPLGQSGAALSHTASHHYPPTPESSFYPSVSSAPYSSHADPQAEHSWAAPSYPPRKEKPKDERPVSSTHSVPKRDDKKETVSFSVDEAQKIIRELKEDNKNLNLQLMNSRESNSKAVLEKEASIEQLQKEIEAVRRQQGEAVNAKQAIAAAEREWQQRMSAKERENQELLARAERESEAKERETQERLSKAEQENAALLARLNKLQLDADSGRAFLLESNSAQEAELRKLKEEARQYDAKVVKLEEESNRQEAELMKLRDETNKLLDEITQMVDEKETALATIKRLEEEKHQLEERLKEKSDGIMAENNAAAAERVKLLRAIDDLEDKLEHAHDLCEERRLRIESMENEELPTLNSQIDLMTRLDEKARDQIAELKEKLEEAEHARDALEKQLVEAEQREMESSLRVAGESKSAADELQRLRFELDSHKVGKSDIEKLTSELESEKKMLEQKVAQVEDEQREALGRISKLEVSVKEVTQAKTQLEEELEIVKETMEREAEDNETAQAEYRSKVEKLEEQVSSLTAAKSALEMQVAQSETKIAETERLLHATDNMLKLLKEDLEQKREQESLGEEKAALETKLASLQEENAQMAQQISERMKQVKVLEEEKASLWKDYEKDVGKLERIIEEKDVELLAKKRLEREVKGLNLELSKRTTKIEQLQIDLADISKIAKDASVRIQELEEERKVHEARSAALTEDKKRASAKASEMGEEILKLESDNKELHKRVGEMNTKILEIVAERDDLLQENKTLRNR